MARDLDWLREDMKEIKQDLKDLKESYDVLHDDVSKIKMRNRFFQSLWSFIGGIVAFLMGRVT